MKPYLNSKQAFLCLALSGLLLPVVLPASPPNIIVMLMDDLGVNDIGVYTYPSLASPGPPPAAAPTDGMTDLPPPNRAYDPLLPGSSLTPRIDSLATDGARLTRFYATHSVCTPTRASLMTGSYATRVGLEIVVYPYTDSRGEAGLSSVELTLPERLRLAGYATGMSGKWHLGHLTDFNPVRHGFETYFGILYSNDMWTGNPYNTTWPNMDLMRGESTLSSYTTGTGHTITGAIDTDAEQAVLMEAMTEEAVSVIDAAVAENRPFFLYYAPHTPHVPIEPHPDFLSVAGTTDDVVRYNDLLKEIDTRVGEILDRLVHHGIEDETLIIFTSDNGPWYSRKGPGALSQGCGSAYPFRGRKNTFWEGGHRVPFLARFNGVIPAGVIREQVASTFDLYTTLSQLAEAPAPMYPGIDGVDILPMLVGTQSDEPHEAFFFYDINRTDSEAIADTTGPDYWKLVSGSVNPDHDGLYRIGEGFTGDFQELTDLSSSFSSVKAALQQRLDDRNGDHFERELGVARSVQIEVETDRITVDENGTATTRIRLSAPANRTVRISHYLGDPDLSVNSGEVLSFTTSNWNTWQTVAFAFDPDADRVDGSALFRAHGDSLTSSTDIHVRELFVFENDLMSEISQLSPPDNPLLLHYRLNESAGIEANDSSPSDNTGTLSGSFATQWEAGQLKGCLIMDGLANAWIDAASPISVSPSNNISVCARIRWNAPSATQNRHIAQQLDAGGIGRTWLAVNPDNQVLSYVGGAPTKGGVIAKDTWYHVAVTSQGGILKLYLDGQLIALENRTIESNTAPFRFGNQKTPASELQWIGGLDDVRIYSGELDPAEIRWLALLRPPKIKAEASVFTMGAAQYLSVTFEQLSNGAGTVGFDYSVDGITFALQSVADLGNAWESNAEVFSQIGTPEAVDPLFEMIRLRFAEELTPGKKQFVRLSADYP